jgi:bacteriocin-like protein
MKILDKNEMKNVKGGFCPGCRIPEVPICVANATDDCDICYYENGDITVVCVTVY